MKLCSVATCSKPARSRGLCFAHYDKFRVYGDPLAGKPRGETSPGSAAHFFRQTVLPSQSDDCILWPFSRSQAGYAKLKIAGFNSLILSRVICQMVHGEPASSGLEASHTCGRGHDGCVNPRHIVWKTRLENQHDRYTHGTIRVGEYGAARKLTSEAVLEIRANVDSLTSIEWAEKFNVRPSTVIDAIRRKTWRAI